MAGLQPISQTIGGQPDFESDLEFTVVYQSTIFTTATGSWVRNIDELLSLTLLTNL